MLPECMSIDQVWKIRFLYHQAQKNFPPEYCNLEKDNLFQHFPKLYEPCFTRLSDCVDGRRLNTTPRCRSWWDGSRV